MCINCTLTITFDFWSRKSPEHFLCKFERHGIYVIMANRDNLLTGLRREKNRQLLTNRTII